MHLMREKVKYFLLGKHCIDKYKSREHQKQKFWFLRPSQIPEVILDSKNNESKVDTVTMAEEVPK
jgi:hypothetical protein